MEEGKEVGGVLIEGIRGSKIEIREAFKEVLTISIP